MTRKQANLNNPQVLDDCIMAMQEIADRYDVSSVDLSVKFIFSMLVQLVYDGTVNLDHFFIQIEDVVAHYRARKPNPCGRKPMSKKMRSCVTKVSRKMGKKKAYPICKRSVGR